MREVGGDGEVKQRPRQLEKAQGSISLQPPAVGEKSPQWWGRALSCGHREVWVGAVGVGEELQPSSVPQPGHPCCQVVLGLLGTSLAMAVLSWGCEVFMLSPEHLEAPVLISLYLWGGGQGGAGGPQPVQALLLPHPSPGDRLVVWAGQAADRQAGAAQGPSSASLHTPQTRKVMLSWHLPPLCHGPSPVPSQLQPQALGKSRALAPSGS